MIIQKVTYKGKSLTSSSTYHITLQSSKKDVDLSTRVDNLTNYHGANAYYTIAGGRLFTFTGKIFGATREDRAIGQKYLNDIITPEGSLENSPTYPLTWQGDDLNIYSTQARVYKMPTYTHEVLSDVIDFSFELFSEDPKYVMSQKWDSGSQTFSSAYHMETLNISIFGGALFTRDQNGIFLGKTQMNSSMNAKKITNAGNFNAGCIINYSGSLSSFSIQNLTTVQKYTLNTTVGNVIYDSTSRPTKVTNNGVDASGYRYQGSKSITLAPGDNYIRFGADLSGGSFGQTDTATISWYDTFINS